MYSCIRIVYVFNLPFQVNNNVIEKDDTVKLQGNPICHMDVQIVGSTAILNIFFN